MFDLRSYTPTDAKDIGSNLRQVRDSKGLTIEQVSQHLRISPQVIEAIERGTIDSYIEQVYGLLCIYTEPIHRIFKSFAIQKSLDDIEGNSDLLNHVADCIVFHKRLHGKPLHLTVVPKARGKSSSRSTNLSGIEKSRTKLKPLSSSVLEFRAQEVIHSHQLYRLPINIYQVAHNLGVNIIFESFPSDFYLKLKAFCYKEEDFSLIGINKSHPSVLQRYSLAHELHHFLYDFSDKFACGPDNENEAIEINAERFAAELLMPKQMVERLITNPLNIHYLTISLVAKHFGVSYEAAAIRLSRFGLVSSAKEVCSREYRKEDKKKTDFLLKEKPKYLKAVFGLETGITSLLEYYKGIKYHSLCGAPITDSSHTICWQCGLEINPPSPKEFCLKNPYRQNPSNLLPNKISSFQRFKDDDPSQLSLNLNVF